MKSSLPPPGPPVEPVPEVPVQAVYAAAEAALSAADCDAPGGAGELTAAIRATGIVRTRRRLLVLPLLTAWATGGDPDQAVLVAAAHHLFCLAAVVLDGVQDGEPEVLLASRAGAPQHPRGVQGKSAPLLPPLPLHPHPAALDINIGLALLFAAQRTLGRLIEWGLSPVRVLALQDDCTRTGYWMCAGQHLDLSVAARQDLTLETYWRMVAAKSGAFFALGARAGAWLGVDDVALLQPYTNYGHHLGLAIQATNDLRELLEKGQLAASNGGGPVPGRLTLPVVYGLTAAPEKVRDELWECLADPGAAARAVELLIELGALHYTLLVVEQHRRHAATALTHATGEPTAHQRLLALLDACTSNLLKEHTPR